MSVLENIPLRLAAVAVFALAAGAVYSETVAPINSLPNPYVGAPFGKLPQGRAWGSTARAGLIHSRTFTGTSSSYACAGTDGLFHRVGDGNKVRERFFCQG
jgi:hypothetical protein